MKRGLLAWCVFVAACGVESVGERAGGLVAAPAGDPPPSNLVPGTWDGAAPVQGAGGFATKPLIMVDGSGGALAVWQSYPDAPDGWQNQGVWASHYDGAAWSTPAPVAAGLQNIYSLRLAVNRSGSAVAAWLGFDGTSTGVLACRFSRDAGWSAATTLATGADQVAAAVSDNGDALVLWRAAGTASFTLWAALDQAGAGWLGPAALATGDLPSGGEVDSALFAAAMDPLGRALVVWAQHSDVTEVVCRRGSQAIGSTGPLSFGPVEHLATYPWRGAVRGAWAQLDAAGRAVAMWRHDDNPETPTYSLAMTRAAATGAWSEAVEVAGPLSAAYGMLSNRPTLAFNSAGYGIALWRAVDDTDATGRVLVKRYAAASGWQDVEVVAEHLKLPMACTSEDAADAADAAVDASGRAIAVWEDAPPDSVNIAVMASEFLPGAGWGPAATLSFEGTAEAPVAALSETLGFAVWARRELLPSGSAIWSSRLASGE